MIARLTGRIVDREANRAIVDVQGVGYEVFAPNRAIEGWIGGEPVTVHVSTQVREDAITLYGFGTASDRTAFQILMTVSGIGPKLALACLDGLPLANLVRAIEAEDLATLSKIPGVGKKTAQRLVLELKGKLPMPFQPIGSAPAAAPADDTFALALTRLGYSRVEIESAKARLAKDGVPADAPATDRVRAALRVLSGRDQ
jgi:Holliday junction DNA helicase RuvA